MQCFLLEKLTTLWARFPDGRLAAFSFVTSCSLINYVNGSNTERYCLSFAASTWLSPSNSGACDHQVELVLY